MIVFHCCVLVGVNFILIPTQTNALNQLAREHNPHGVSITNTTMQIGAAFGSAIFIGLLGAIQENRLADIVNPELLQVQSATVSAVDSAFLAALGFVILGSILALFIKLKKAPQHLS